jgi:NADPH:quinone reductase-like Zn-dependent oxidoreductase
MLIIPPIQGAYAEFIAVLETQILRKPPRLSLVEAASIPEAFITGESPVGPYDPSRSQR